MKNQIRHLKINSDQFWKQKGGNASYTLLQDDYNEFIKSKGFDLFRGEIGGDKTHLTNAMKQQIELNALNQEIKEENELLKEANKAENKFIDKVDIETSKEMCYDEKNNKLNLVLSKTPLFVEIPNHLLLQPCKLLILGNTIVGIPSINCQWA